MAKVISSIGDTSINRTSELINDGENSTSRFVEQIELGDVAFSNDYNDLDNIPSSFPPSAHTHPISDIINLQLELDSKESLANKGIPNGYPSLDAGGKVPVSQLPSSIMEYKGIYNALTNTPTLINGVGDTGDVYKVTVAGPGVNGLNFVIGDYAIYNGTIWEKSHSGEDKVTSVFGRNGDILAQNGDYTASQITNVPFGNISSLNVQAALNELDSEKSPITGGTGYIQNQNAVVQTANMRISGTGEFNNDLTVNGFIKGTVTKVLPSGNTTINQTINLTGSDATSNMFNKLIVNYNEDGFINNSTKYGQAIELVNNKSSNDAGALVASGNRVNINGTGNVTDLICSFNSFRGTGTGTVSSAVLFKGDDSPVLNTYSITNFYGLLLGNNPQNNVTNSRGIFIGELFGSSVARGIELNISSGTGKHNIYAQGTANNYINGNTSFGAATDSGEKLQVYGTTKLNSTVTLGTLPTTSASGYELLTRNTSTGVVEKITSSSLVPSTRTININGVTQDLSADRQYRAGLSNTGVLTYTGATINTTTTINVGAVTGVITNNETTPNTPSYQLVSYAGATNITVPTIAGGTGTYVLLNNAGALVFQNTFPTSAQRKSMIYLSKISHPNLATISFVIDEPDFVTSPLQQFRDLYQVIQYTNQGIIASGNAGLTINTTNGVIGGDGINFVVDKTNPNSITIPAGAPRNFLLLNQSGAVGSFVTAIDPANYDVGGVTTAVGGSTNNSTIQYLYYAPGVGFAIQRGQTVYPSLVDAIAAVGKESFVLRANLVNNSILIAAICLRHTTTAMNNTAFVRILPADKFGQLGGASSGISVTSLQTAYNNSLIPQITTSTALGAVTLKNGGATDLVNVFATQNLSGTNTTVINGQGVITSSPSVSATSALARGTILTPTLTATANNDALIGLDINPTFNNGAFTGVNNIGLKVKGDIINAGTPTNIGDVVSPFGTIHLINLRAVADLNIGSGYSSIGQAGFKMFSSTRNIVLQNGGTFTDAGYRLDVSGTTRLNGNTIINGDSTINGFVNGTATVVLPTSNTFAGQTFNLTGVDATSQLINRWSTNYNEDGFGVNSGQAAYDYRSTNNKSTNQASREQTTYNIGAYQSGTGSLGSLNSLQINMQVTGTGTVTNARFIRTNSGPWATTSQITNFTGLDLSFMPNTTGGGVLNSRGIMIGDVFGSTLARGIDLNVSSGIGKHNLYVQGSAPNYFKGAILGNTTVDAGYLLDINGTTRLNGTTTLGVTPTTSAGTYDLVTRNASTGVFEKIASNIYQPYDNQIEVSTNSNVDNSWHGQTVLFTANCTITVPATLNNSLMFPFRTLAGVTVTWAITAPFTWETTPSTTPEKTVGHFMRRSSTNTIILDM